MGCCKSVKGGIDGLIAWLLDLLLKVRFEELDPKELARQTAKK